MTGPIEPFVCLPPQEDKEEQLINFLKRLDRFDFLGGVQGEVRKEARRLLIKQGHEVR